MKHGSWCSICNPELGRHPRTAEQSHLVALAERDALTAQVGALTAQRDEAVRLLRGAPRFGSRRVSAEWDVAVAAFLRGVDQ